MSPEERAREAQRRNDQLLFQRRSKPTDPERRKRAEAATERLNRYAGLNKPPN